MHRNLFDCVNIDPAKTNLPDGTNPDAADACAKYNAIIHSVGGINLQLLGLGLNGHIGFNEPGEAFELETHCVDLTQETIEANKRFFDGNVDLVPKQAGHPHHHAGTQGADGGQRRRQGRDRQEGLLRPGHSRSARQHPADAPRLHPRG